MIAYLDSSAAIKVLVREDGSDAAAEAIESSSITGSSRITFVECHSALSRLVRDKVMTAKAATRAKRKLDALWKRVTVIEFTPEVMRKASQAAADHHLKSLDAIQFASAQGFLPADVGTFLSFDRQLLRAAHEQGWKLIAHP